MSEFMLEEDLFDPAKLMMPAWKGACVDCGTRGPRDAETKRCRPCWARTRDRCPAWKDGEHCFVPVHSDMATAAWAKSKACKCGATVEAT